MSATRSKRQSAKPNSSAPRSDLTIFVDRSLGRRLVPEALRAAGFSVVAHDEVFEQNTPDEVWLTEAGKSGWLVISADKAIRRKPNEIDALVRNNVRTAILTSGNLSGTDQATLFVNNGRKIQDVLMSTAAPAIFSMTKDGKLTKMKL